MLAHNGEINTLNGNINWMKSHEITAWPRELFGAACDDIKPVIQAGRLGFRGARQRVRGAGARRPRRADGQDAC